MASVAGARGAADTSLRDVAAQVGRIGGAVTYLPGIPQGLGEAGKAR
ncbi:MAG TPA: hypothetical protein VF652_01175 [Allosphingosinicella sp.]